MRFTTPSIASAGESVFAFEKYSFPKPELSSPLLFSSPASALRFHFFEWLSELLVLVSEILRSRLSEVLRLGSSAERDRTLSNPDAQLREGSRLICSKLP